MLHADAQKLQVCVTLKHRYFGMILVLPGNPDPIQQEQNRLNCTGDHTGNTGKPELAESSASRYNSKSVTKNRKLELTWIRALLPSQVMSPPLAPAKSGQKKRATLSDHPIAIARSCITNPLFRRVHQASSDRS